MGDLLDAVAGINKLMTELSVLFIRNKIKLLKSN
jgi:hypothetical protein